MNYLLLIGGLLGAGFVGVIAHRISEPPSTYALGLASGICVFAFFIVILVCLLTSEPVVDAFLFRKPAGSVVIAVQVGASYGLLFVTIYYVLRLSLRKFSTLIKHGK